MRFEISNIGTSGQTTWTCASHTIRFTFARGNQHQRTEHGCCTYCGLKFKRAIRWRKKQADWWKEVV